nr:hypothetical protein [Tanacetum cinerariifolium]
MAKGLRGSDDTLIQAMKLKGVDEDIKMQMVDDNVGNQVRHNAVQNDGNEVGQNAVQNLGIQIVENMNGLSVVSKISNQYGNRNVVTAPAEGNEKEAGIQSTQKEFEFIVVADAYKETKRVKVNFTLEDTLQQASTSGTQTNKALNYDSDGSAKYIELLEPIPKPHQVQQNDSNVISAVSSVKRGEGTVEQHSATIEETRAYHESVFHNLPFEVEKVNSVNRKMKETNVEWTIELARYKNQVKFFEISQEKYDKLERCYQKSIYQE